MERKVGEIFEHNGEWYQCIEESTCEGCSFNMQNCCNKVAETFGECYFIGRSDEKDVIFRKLEKVEEPYYV